MSGLRLRFKEAPTLPVDAAGLSPAVLAGMSGSEIAALPVRVGRDLVPLADLAEIHPGEPDTLVIEGAFSALDRLGHGLRHGRVEVYGDVGAFLGQDMTGGRIELFGSAGPYAAAGMKGGVIHIQANAGHRLGGALPGEARGMLDGTVMVGGDAGDRLGDRMRRGLIVVHGRTGDLPASRMIGGTIVVQGACGSAPGCAMRRGTLLLGTDPGERHLLPTFADNGRHALPWLGLLARHVARMPNAPELDIDRVRRWTGCASVGGKGEILVTA